MSWNQPAPIAPQRPHNERGEPQFGTYEGALSSTNLDAVARYAGLGPVHQLRSEKRWQWFGAISPEVAVGGALIQTGYAGQLFVWVFDRKQKKMIRDVSMTLPKPLVTLSDSPNQGHIAHFRALGQHFEVLHDVDGVNVRVCFRGVDMSLRFQSINLPPMTAICPVPGDRVNVTQKQAGLMVEGVVRAQNQTFSFYSDESTGFLDYSHGLLAYDTSWLWAIGAGKTTDGRHLSFNLTDRFNEGLENVVWLDGKIYHVGSVSFRYNPQTPLAPWHVTSLDHGIELKLSTEGIRQENVNLGLIQSKYVQPLGRWTGEIRGENLVDAVGVAEDHMARW